MVYKIPALTLLSSSFSIPWERAMASSFKKEISMYVRNDNGLPIDKYNHALDEARYGNNYFYKTYIA